MAVGRLDVEREQREEREQPTGQTDEPNTLETEADAVGRDEPTDDKAGSEWRERRPPRRRDASERADDGEQWEGHHQHGTDDDADLFGSVWEGHTRGTERSVENLPPEFREQSPDLDAVAVTLRDVELHVTD